VNRRIMPTLRPSNPRELLRLIFCSVASAAAASIGFCVLRAARGDASKEG
jgi:hypothetical protein